jgi:hypothetical protein
MNESDLAELHKSLDKLPVYGKDKHGYSLIHYGDVATMLDRVYRKSEQRRLVKDGI